MPAPPDVETDPPPAMSAPDPGYLLPLLQGDGVEARDGHLVIRGQHRWLAVVDGRWTITPDHAGICIDAATIEKLRGDGVYLDRGAILIGEERYVLVVREIAGVPWAELAIGGPIDPDIVPTPRRS